MSGDEAVVESSTDNRQAHPRVFFIVEAAWQSEPFKRFVRTLDEWNIEDWRQKVGDILPGGNSPRRRVALATPRVVNSPAPIGLWRNCYDPGWLKKLKGHVRERLQIIDEDYDFSLPTYSQLNKGDMATDDTDDEDEDEDEDEDGYGDSDDALKDTDMEDEDGH